MKIVLVDHGWSTVADPELIKYNIIQYNWKVHLLHPGGQFQLEHKWNEYSFIVHNDCKDVYEKKVALWDYSATMYIHFYIRGSSGL